jgi:hypothetical protein
MRQILSSPGLTGFAANLALETLKKQINLQHVNPYQVERA